MVLFAIKICFQIKFYYTWVLTVIYVVYWNSCVNISYWFRRPNSASKTTRIKLTRYFCRVPSMWYHCSYRYPVPLQCQLSCYTAVRYIFVLLYFGLKPTTGRNVSWWRVQCSISYDIAILGPGTQCVCHVGTGQGITLHGMLFQSRKFSYLPDVSLKIRNVSVPCPGKRVKNNNNCNSVSVSQMC